MDSSYWDKYNKKIVFDETRKLFFNKYLYKMSVSAIGARYINMAKGKSIEEYVQARQRLAKLSMSKSTSHWLFQLSEVDTDLLENLRDLSKTHTLKCRADDLKFSVYTNTEDELKLFHSGIKGKHKYAIAELSSPDPAAITLLQQGHILTDNAPFKYKVMFRDGKYTKEAKRQALGYLDGLGDVACVSKAVREHLSSNYGLLWGGWFYTNDLSVLTFLGMILPGSIGTTYELTKI